MKTEKGRSPYKFVNVPMEPREHDLVRKMAKAFDMPMVNLMKDNLAINMLQKIETLKLKKIAIDTINKKLK